jgi:hypothetical protein
MQPYPCSYCTETNPFDPIVNRYRRRSIVRQPRRKRTSHDRDDDEKDIGPEKVEVSNIAISCVYVNPVYAGNHYARHHLQLMHYILAPKKDLPEFPTGVWGEAPKIPGGWKGDAAFSVSIEF